MAGESVSGQWAREEFAQADLGDSRRNERLIEMAVDLSAHPQASVNQAASSWADAKAAYRFFKNESVSAEAILEPHLKNTAARCSHYPVVLAIQDTSFLLYGSRPKTEGLGPITKNPHTGGLGIGLIQHSVLAVSPDGLPLGLLSQLIYARERLRTPAERRAFQNNRKPIDQKESIKWIESLQRAFTLEPDKTTFVLVADREADIYDLFKECHNLECPFVIRANVDRAINRRTRRQPSYLKLWEHMESQPVRGSLKLQVWDPVKGRERIARLQVRFAPVTVWPPTTHTLKKNGPDLPPLSLNVVFIRELGPAAEPLEWMLLTSLPVDSLPEAIEKIHWYKARWNIESFHKVLKSGCRIEQAQFRDAERLKKYVALMSVVAWRLFYLSRLARLAPDAPCTFVFTDPEWKALWLLLNPSKKLPAAPPSLYQALCLIARLGGFLARKSDGEPGFVSIWRGFERFAEAANLYSIVNSMQNCG